MNRGGGVCLHLHSEVFFLFGRAFFTQLFFGAGGRSSTLRSLRVSSDVAPILERTLSKRGEFGSRLCVSMDVAPIPEGTLSNPGAVLQQTTRRSLGF